MGEIINTADRKALLKHMILQLHEGVAPDLIKNRIIELLKKVPYNDVVEVEQELISEGLPTEEVLKLCDLHSYVLDGNIDLSGQKDIPAGHPVDTFKKENQELKEIAGKLGELYLKVNELNSPGEIEAYVNRLKAGFNSLMDVDKHYRRKENLLFPYMEKNGITGPPKVMWGKHDEIREQLKASIDSLGQTTVTKEELDAAIQMLFKPASSAVIDMVLKEEEILLPMCLDKLTTEEWYEIYKQTPEIGFCLYDPRVEWKPEGISENTQNAIENDVIKLPSGSFSVKELTAILNTLPVDITFVDKNDKVSYFSQSSERIFDRNRAILQRDVRMCHPPQSVGVVEKIMDDFKTGKESRAPFWINMGGRFIHIEYFALRDDDGNYLGTLEVSQDITEKRSITGEQRLLSYK